VNPHRAATYSEATETWTLLAAGWCLEEGYWRAPKGYPFTTTFTRVTAFEIEVFLGDDFRRHPHRRPGLIQRVGHWCRRLLESRRGARARAETKKLRAV
jgi:hypothetical protein